MVHFYNTLCHARTNGTQRKQSHSLGRLVVLPDSDSSVGEVPLAVIGTMETITSRHDDAAVIVDSHTLAKTRIAPVSHVRHRVQAIGSVGMAFTLVCVHLLKMDFAGAGNERSTISTEHSKTLVIVMDVLGADYHNSACFFICVFIVLYVARVCAINV